VCEKPLLLTSNHKEEGTFCKVTTLFLPASSLLLGSRLLFFMEVAMSAQLLQELRTLIFRNEQPPDPLLLLDLVPILPEQLLSQAVRVAVRIEDQWLYARLLTVLVARLPENDCEALMEDELLGGRTFLSACWRAEALTKLALFLSEPQKSAVVQKALEVALAIPDEILLEKGIPVMEPTIKVPYRLVGKRAEALTKLAPFLSEPLKDEMLREVWHTARAIPSGYWRAEALIQLAGSLTDPMKEGALREALQAVWGIENAKDQAQALTDLIPTLHEPLLHEVLQAARAMKSESWQEWVLGKIVPTLARLLPQEAQIGVPTPSGSEQVETLAAADNRVRQLLEEIPEAGRNALLEEMLDEMIKYLDAMRTPIL
jgi:hypothetical protein